VITSLVKIYASPQNQKDIKKALKSLVAGVPIQTGCAIRYCTQDLKNRNAFFLFEEWQTAKDLERYLCSDQYRKVLALLDMSVEAPVIRFDRVSARRGMDLIKAARQQGK